MKIILTTLGSRGDVQPYLALAAGLKHAGHHPTLAAPETFADWIQSCGIDVLPLPFNPQEAMKKLSKDKGLRMRALMSILRDGMKEVQDDVWRAAQDTDFFIQSGTGMGVMEIAATRGIPGAFAYLFPFAPTRAFPMFWLPFRHSLGGIYNLLTHKVISRVLWQFGGGMNNDWRKRLGLKPWRSESEMFAYAQSLRTPFYLRIQSQPPPQTCRLGRPPARHRLLVLRRTRRFPTPRRSPPFPRKRPAPGLHRLRQYE